MVDKADIPLDIIQTHILNRLDGATLASASCASSQFRALCSDDQLWRNICNSTWPSTTHPRVVSAISAFPSAHRSFYLDSFPSMHHQLPETTTQIGGDWFLDHKLFLHLLDPTETVPVPLQIHHGINGMSLLKKHLRVSWIMIDPNNKRALNVASQKAVSLIWQWDGKTTLLESGSRIQGESGSVGCVGDLQQKGK
ncbi:F-box protein At2g27310-like [Henckelia pumila]|uniref:F-box protein At2g27310-like n=1 Tax=Henckelia pumila TaxID=405737 RepID=UPI003C6DD3E8